MWRTHILVWTLQIQSLLVENLFIYFFISKSTTLILGSVLNLINEFAHSVRGLENIKFPKQIICLASEYFCCAFWRRLILWARLLLQSEQRRKINGDHHLPTINIFFLGGGGHWKYSRLAQATISRQRPETKGKNLYVLWNMINHLTSNIEAFQSNVFFMEMLKETNKHRLR